MELVGADVVGLRNLNLSLFARADDIDLVANPVLLSILSVSGLSELDDVEPAPPPAGD